MRFWLLAGAAEKLLARRYVTTAVCVDDVRLDAFDEFVFASLRSRHRNAQRHDECHRAIAPPSRLTAPAASPGRRPALARAATRDCARLDRRVEVSDRASRQTLVAEAAPAPADVEILHMVLMAYGDVLDATVQKVRRRLADLPRQEHRQQHETPAFAEVSCKRMKGLEPSTFCMASRRSSQLSYIREGAGL